MIPTTESTALDDALAALAHELRTPLTAIRGFADLLAALDGSEDTETRRDITARLLRNTEQLEALVDNMLDIAIHGGVGVEALNPTTVCLRSLAGDVVNDVAVALGGHNFEVRGAPAYAFADPRAVTRILVSLLTNAAHYSPDGSTIVVETSSWGAHRVVVAVSDAGPGIPEDERAMVFERFWRGDVARERVRGLGMGLAIARELCVMSGGEIYLTETPSGGACFEVSLPAATF